MGYAGDEKASENTASNTEVELNTSDDLEVIRLRHLERTSQILMVDVVEFNKYLQEREAAWLEAARLDRERWALDVRAAHEEYQRILSHCLHYVQFLRSIGAEDCAQLFMQRTQEHMRFLHEQLPQPTMWPN